MQDLTQKGSLVVMLGFLKALYVVETPYLLGCRQWSVHGP